MTTTINITSSMDGTHQRCNIFPAADAQQARPLLVALHTWSADYTSSTAPQVEQAALRHWHCIVPDFRGRNNNPQACASALAQRDVVDAVDWACENLNVDRNRIYLAGGSGGGHMALRMAAACPHLFAAVSAWCAITDLAAWHAKHIQTEPPGRYALEVEACVGGRPGSSPQVDGEIFVRSPLYHIGNAWHLPIDFSAGVHDGQTGSVPFRHTIDAFNVIARACGTQAVTEAEIQQLWNHGRLDQPSDADVAEQPEYGRAIHLRRWAGPSRLTIFEGGHEMLPVAACHWLAQHSRCGRITPEQVAAPGASGDQATLSG